jgi:undecaprenyl-diphosphatase
VDLIKAIVLGIVQGFTEWLPISSTAHLRLVPALLGWEDPGAAFTAAIQLGTMLAVLIYFGKDLWAILRGWLGSLAGRSQDRQSKALGWAIVVGTIPVIVCGLAFKDRIENDWRSLYVIATALIGMGLLLAFAEWKGAKRRNLDELTIRDGLWVGLWQAISLIPGSSRSGSCITGGLFAGMERGTAARFAFLLSVPSILAAGVYSLYKHRGELLGEQLTPMLVANVFSFAVGYATIAFLMRFLQKHPPTVFIVYRVALGLAILAMLQTGHLKP